MLVILLIIIHNKLYSQLIYKMAKKYGNYKKNKKLLNFY
jgi:hypothetical protein